MEAIRKIIEQRVAAYENEIKKQAERDQKMQQEKYKQLELQHREYVRRQSQVISDEEHQKTVRDIQELQKSLQVNNISSTSSSHHIPTSSQSNSAYHLHIPSYPSANYTASPIPKFDLKPLTPNVGNIPPELPPKPTAAQIEKHNLPSSPKDGYLTSLPQVNIPSSSPFVKQTTPEPPAAAPTDKQTSEITNKIRARTEGGEPLRTIFLPERLRKEFLSIAESNTRNKLETCGMLCGKLNRNAFFITKLVIPHQESTPDTCATIHEEILFEYLDTNDLILIGWIHTHPTQSCFMSSVDLHTQNSYQIMLKESIAIVCAPTKSPSWDIFRLTDPNGMGIIRKCMKSSFHPHPEPDLYRSALAQSHVVLTKDIPFQIEDLRKIKPQA